VEVGPAHLKLEKVGVATDTNAVARILIKVENNIVFVDDRPVLLEKIAETVKLLLVPRSEVWIYDYDARPVGPGARDNSPGYWAVLSKIPCRSEDIFRVYHPLRR
jgi:hypothetical protein